MATKNSIQRFATTLLISGAMVGSVLAQPKLPLDSLHPPKLHKHVHVELKSINVGDTLTLWVEAPASELFTLEVTTHSDSLLSSLQVTGGLTVLPVFPLGHYHFKLLDDSGKVVKKGKFDVHPKPTPKPKKLKVKIVSDDDTVNLWIDTAASQVFTLLLKNHEDSLLATFTVHGGKNLLTGIAEGHYHFDLLKDTVVVLSGKFDVRSKPDLKPKPIKVRVLPRDSVVSVLIDADSSKLFTLNLKNHKDSLLATYQVHGGLNLLTGIAEGHYHFDLVGDTGTVVAKGKFDVRKPREKPLEVKFKGDDTLVVWIDAPSTSNFVLNVLTHKDSLITSFPVHGGSNPLTGLAYGHYHYQLLDDSGAVVKTGKFDFNAPKPKPLQVKFKSGDSLQVWIGAPATSIFTLRVLAHQDSLVATFQVNGGTNDLSALPYGHYHYELLSDTTVVKKGKFNLHGPHVHVVVGPNPSFGTLRFLHVHAPETEQFTVLISDANMLVHTLSVTGGVTQLPVLSVGVYYYKVLDSNNQAVAKGRIMIME